MCKISVFLICAVLISGCINSSQRDHVGNRQFEQDAAQAELSIYENVIETVSASLNSVGNKVLDAKIVASLNAQYIADDYIDALHVNVDSGNGHVTLTGRVSTEYLIRRASAIALSTKGVESVNNKLYVVERY